MSENNLYSNNNLMHLPLPVLGHILDFLSLTEEHEWLSSSTTPQQQQQQQQREHDEIRRHRTCLRVFREAETRRMFLRTEQQQHPSLRYAGDCYGNMVRLDLGKWANDDILESVARRMPKLQRLEMVSSEAVTSTGFLMLSRLHQLRYVDVTFCDGISYNDTLMLRRQHQQRNAETATAMLTIRRQPAWMDGRFQTPFENDGQHTYWPDGTFQYERDNCSVGFVYRLQRDHRHDLIRIQTQPANFVPPPTWPAWTHFLFRPAVSLLYRQEPFVDDGGGNTADHQEPKSVLVAQRISGVALEDYWPRPENWSLPMGQSFYFARDGSRILTTPTDDDRRYVMVTRIPVQPLLQMTPPEELLEQNREFLAQHREFVFEPSEEALEARLNHILRERLEGGHGDDG